MSQMGASSKVPRVFSGSLIRSIFYMTFLEVSGPIYNAVNSAEDLSDNVRMINMRTKIIPWKRVFLA